MVVSKINNITDVKGFSSVTEKELVDVNGGWLFDAVMAFGFVCMCIYVILDTLNN